jgi:acetyl esterase/lipase
MKQAIFLITGILLFSLQAVSQRFVSPVFDEIQIDTAIVYGNADYWDDGNFGWGVYEPEDITLDLYQPASDTMTKRPLVIALFGGAFLKGSPGRPDIIAWCDSLASYGYVAAAIDYRLGFNPSGSGGTTGPDVGLKRAAWRAIQDGRAAVRFFKEMHDVYNIDTTQIFLLGNSAGAITALHVGYMNPDDWLPEAGEYLSGTSPNNYDLGCLDCSTSLEGHWAHSAEVAGIISLWGATLDLAYFEETEDIPVMLVHGTDDGIVPYGTGSPFNMGTGWQVTFDTHGSLPIHQRLDSLGKDHEFYPYDGEGHTLYSCGNFDLETFEKDSFPCEHWPTVFYDGIDFLADHNVYSGDAVKLANQESSELNIFPNPASQYVIIEAGEKKPGDVHAYMYDNTGHIVRQFQFTHQQTKVNLSGLQEGIYLLRIEDENKTTARKLIIR